MWELRNNTPFEAEWMAAIDKDGRRRFVVVVKATFDIQPDGTTVKAEEPLPINPAPEYWGEPGASSLKVDADLVPTKPGTDLYVVGGADNGLGLFSSFEIFDTVGDSWSAGPAMPAGARAGMFSGVIGTDFYVVGGRIGAATPTATVEVYDRSSATSPGRGPPAGPCCAMIARIRLWYHDEGIGASAARKRLKRGVARRFLVSACTSMPTRRDRIRMPGMAASTR